MIYQDNTDKDMIKNINENTTHILCVKINKGKYITLLH